VIILGQNGKQDTGHARLGDMSRIISEIQNNFSLDSLKYFPDFEYNESPYANMDFPEIGKIDLFSIVGQPNKNSSQETLSELKYISRLTTNRSKEDIDLIYLVDEDPMLLFYPLIKKLNLKFDEQLFKTTYYTCLIAIVDHLKYFYNRARPFQIAELLDIKIDRIITKTHHSPSYPSGHTMYAALIAEFLISEHPEHKSKFDTLAGKTGLARVIQGVHYPSDNRAAIQIVKTIFPNLKQYFTKER
jgi:hypothetical protein